MNTPEPSHTAATAVVLRAAHQILDDGNKILDDPLSLGLVAGSSREEILSNERMLQQPVARLARAQAVLRSRFMEDQLAEAAHFGTKTFVNLGAGLDTFAFRQPDWASNMRLIEVDHADTQAFKMVCMARAKQVPPENLTLFPLDLEDDAIERQLGKSLPAAEPLFVSWLGVTQYLAAAAIETILKFLCSFPKPTSVCLTVNLPERALEGADLAAARLGSAAAAEAGEPWRSCFEPEAFCRALCELGFSTAFHLTPERAFSRYFAGRQDGLCPSRVQQIVHATV